MYMYMYTCMNMKLHVLYLQCTCNDITHSQAHTIMYTHHLIYNVHVITLHVKLFINMLCTCTHTQPQLIWVTVIIIAGTHREEWE